MVRLLRGGRVLLAFFLVPVVIFGTPVQASAVSTGYQGVTIDFPGVAGGTGAIECWFPVRLNETVFETSGGECFGGMDISPGWKQRGEYGTGVTLSMQGTGCSGQSSGLMGQGSQDSWQGIHSTIPVLGFDAGPDCDPSHACLTITDNSGTEEWRCEPVELEPIDNSPDACPYGAPELPFVETTATSHKVTYTINNATAKNTAQFNGQTWWVYWLIKPDWFNGTRIERDFVTKAAAFDSGEQLVKILERWAGGSDGYAKLPLYGLGIANPDAYAGFQYHEYSVGGVGSPGGWGLAGINDPANCAWYWGSKLAEFPDSDIDEPAGPVPSDTTAAPTPPESPLGGDPDGYTAPADEPSFWDAILRAIRSLGSMIAGIAGAILDGLTGLFVPDSAVLSSEVDRIKGAWDDTSPMQTIDAVQDLGSAFTIAGPTGCQGPGLTFSNPLAGGAGTTVHFLDACGTEMGKFASMVKTALTVTVYVGGVLAAVRIIGASFGLDLRLSRGDED